MAGFEARLSQLFPLAIQSRKENPQKPTQLSSRSHPRHLVGADLYATFWTLYGH